MKYKSKGAIHLHTTCSDGTGSLKEVVKAAKRAGLEWIIITDHNNLACLSEEGWHEGIAVIVGEEISPDLGNHYLAFDIKQEIPDSLSPRESIEEVNRQGGFGFVAHPDENIKRKNIFRPLRWADWELRGFQGLEIWNYMSDWVDKYDTERAAYGYFFKNQILTGPTENVLQWWDKLNSETEEVVPAIGSLDSHAIKCSCLKIFPYYDMFKTITNYIYTEEKLSSDFQTAKRQVYDAIRRGDNLIVNRIWSKKSDEINICVENHALTVKLPKFANIRVIHNGQLIREVAASAFYMGELKSGKYRVEVYYKNHPWIFSNPIIVE